MDCFIAQLHSKHSIEGGGFSASFPLLYISHGASLFIALQAKAVPFFKKHLCLAMLQAQVPERGVRAKACRNAWDSRRQAFQHPAENRNQPMPQILFLHRMDLKAGFHFAADAQNTINSEFPSIDHIISLAFDAPKFYRQRRDGPQGFVAIRQSRASCRKFESARCSQFFVSASD